MPYLILVIGVLILLYALYRFFLRANITQIKALFFTISALTVVVAMFYLAVTGRLPAALGLGAALVPIVIGYLRRPKPKSDSAAKTEITTRKEALEILGLQDNASESEIKAAYKKLMKKVHPDQEGSEWMAAKLNAAKDILLGD